MKVPQLVKCLRAQSVENLSYVATLLELAAVTFACSYNLAKGFPFRLVRLLCLTITLSHIAQSLRHSGNI